MAKKAAPIEIKWKDRKHWAWFPFSFTVYKLSSERLYIQTGFFNTHYDETLLYRIVDLCLERSLAQKLFGTGTVVLYTKSDTQGAIRLENIKNPIAVKDMFSNAVEEVRSQRGVVGREFYSSDRDLHDGEGREESEAPDEQESPAGFDFHNDH